MFFSEWCRFVFLLCLTVVLKQSYGRIADEVFMKVKFDSLIEVSKFVDRPSAKEADLTTTRHIFGVLSDLKGKEIACLICICVN